MPAAAPANKLAFAAYLRDPRPGFFNFDWRALIFFRLGLLITNVPLPRYSALYSLSSAKRFSPV